MSKLIEIANGFDPNRTADVVFVHGLGGDGVRTWQHDRTDSDWWPHWLAKDNESVGVWSLQYAASPSLWSKIFSFASVSEDAGHAMSLPDRAGQVLDLFVQAGLGKRPLVFVAHSLGGLLVKQVLRASSDEVSETGRRSVVDNTRSVLFLGTPHRGAALATLATNFSLVFGPSVSLAELRRYDPHLGNLYDWYRNHASERRIVTRTYCEGRGIAGVKIVESDSSHPGTGQDPVTLDEDHISLAKPRSRESQVYRALNELVQGATRRRTLLALGSPDRASSTEGGFLRQLQFALEVVQSDVTVCLIERSWVFTLLFSTALARERGVRVSVIADSTKLHRRYRLLSLLGCRVGTITLQGGRAPFEGAVSDPSDFHHGMALPISIKPKDGTYARLHLSPIDHYAVSGCAALVERLPVSWQPVDEAATRPTFVTSDPTEVAQLLKRVRMYRDSMISFEEVRIERTRPVTTTVVSAKLAQAHLLVRTFLSRGWQLFSPVSVGLTNGNHTILVPPVLEERDGVFQVAEGHSRIFALRELGFDVCWAMVVRRVSAPPPAPLSSWPSVRLGDSREARPFSELARHIETATHEHVWDNE